MTKINIIFPKSYDFNGLKPKISIDVKGKPVSASIVRSALSPEGAHFVVDIPNDVESDSFIEAVSREGAHAYKRALVVVDTKECIECGQCTALCAYEALVLDDNFHLIVNRENCISCRACIDCCPRRAITLA